MTGNPFGKKVYFKLLSREGIGTASLVIFSNLKKSQGTNDGQQLCLKFKKRLEFVFLISKADEVFVHVSFWKFREFGLPC